MQKNKFKNKFLLRRDITYLNFGSFGACPKYVFKKYQQFQLKLEQEPVQFITVEGLQYLQKARNTLAHYINCKADEVVYVTNPSYAINIVAKSIALNKDDEVLTTNLEYGACDKTWLYYCKKKGAKYVQQKINFPLTGKEDFVQQFFKGLTPKTKVIFISHITSSTGLILPVAEICRIAKKHGLLTIIDGAHAPGQLPINLKNLQADIYTGACHKWMLAPKGCSFLYIKKSLQNLFDPLVISWGYNSSNPSPSQFLDYHQQQGTRDFSAFLSLPAALNFMQKNNWSSVAKNCRLITKNNALRFCNLLNAQPLCPITNDFIGQMYSIPIKTKQPEKLHDLLLNKYKIQVPIMPHNDSVFLRYSIQAFNTQKDLDKLFNALQNIINTTDYIEL